MNTLAADLLALEGKVALVAGGGGGIGSPLAALLLRAGAVVAVLEHAGRQGPAGTTTLACELTDSAQVAAAVESVVREHGRLDVLVHCAGTTRDGLIFKLGDEDWHAVLEANLASAFYLLRAASPALREAGGGAVVLVSSINGERGKAGQANYAASKAGLNALARTAARELGRFGVRVNALAPGWVDTPMTASLPAELRARALEETALGRLAEPGDVAAAALFLCSSLSRHVTGQVLRVDGGQLIA